MTNRFWQTNAQMAGLEPLSPKFYCIPRIDDQCVANNYDRCPKVFFSAIAHEATVIYWL